MGSGRVYFDSVSSRYLVDLSVVAKYNVTTDLALWEESFKVASAYLFEATKGQMQLGKIGVLTVDCGVSDDDVRLTSSTAHSEAVDYWIWRTKNSKKMKGFVELTQIAKVQPLETTHEMGHYVVGLMDEYISSGSNRYRVCTKKPESGACIMEHAYNHGVILHESESGAITSTDPSVPVTDFCFPSTTPVQPYDHLYCNNGAGGCSVNAQQTAHEKSCWDTFVAHFGHFEIPPHDSSPTQTLNPIDWFLRSKPKKCSLAIFGSESLKANGNTFLQIQNALIAWIKFVGSSDSSIAIVKDQSPNSFIRDMAPLATQDDVQQLVELVKSEFQNGNSQESPPFAGIDQFDDNQMGSYQSLILIVPGNGSFSSKPIQEFVNDLYETVESKFISLFVITIGNGELATELKKSSSLSPRVNHFALPNPSNNFVGNHAQHLLVESYFLESQSHGVVANSTGRLPKFSITDIDSEAMPVDEDSSNGNRRQLFLHPQSEGFDFPILIEESAEEAFFVASFSTDEQIEFTLIRPDGRPVTDSADILPNEKIKHFHVIGEGIAGRWIMRLRRIGPGLDGDRNAIPYHLIAAAVNSKIKVSTEVSITGDLVNFECATLFDSPLDFVDAKVDVFKLEDFGINPDPIRSVVLRRETAQNIDKDQRVEISTGRQSGSTSLGPGDYVAVFYVANSGQAVFANNSDHQIIGYNLPEDIGAIPAFRRTTKKYFSVGELQSPD